MLGFDVHSGRISNLMESVSYNKYSEFADHALLQLRNNLHH